MNDLSWAVSVRLVHERAEFRCEYCQTSQRVTGQAMHVEHIDPRGGDHLDNLCLSCPNCNLSKAAAVEAIDPQTGHIEVLFHPRRQQWSDHFEWDADGTRVIGQTSVGRATVARFKMNNDRVVIARRIWVRAGVSHFYASTVEHVAPDWFSKLGYATLHGAAVALAEPSK